MDAETYIGQYGHTLTESEKRYIRAFGAPSEPALGASRNPSTAGLRIADDPHGGQRDSFRSTLDDAAH